MTSSLAIRVRNTFGRRIELFKPFEPPFVSMYVCGPTPYDHTHIGHARTFVAFDGIKRYLEIRGYKVFHIQNITDIDDKIINKAREQNISWREVADKYAREYLELLDKLKIKINIHPRVTDHIPDIISFISKLIEKGHAYPATSGSVYFSVDSYPGYGQLSGKLNTEQWNQEEETLHEKKKPYDFALWKAAKPGEPWWSSPWGRGRPGWHIECSVMSMKYTGGRLDIHGGAADLIFPHHENERAQSEALLGYSPWVKYWLHTGYLTIEGEKMSKSLGNIILLKDAVEKWGPETLRTWLLSAHYRAQIEYSEQSLHQAKRLVERFRGMISSLQRKLKGGQVGFSLSQDGQQLLTLLRAIRRRWHEELSNDFNFAGALRETWELTNLYYSRIENNEEAPVLLYALEIASEMNQLLGIADDLLTGTSQERLIENLVNLIVEVRSELRKRKLYELSDKIRSSLIELGVILHDYKDRTEWRLQ